MSLNARPAQAHAMKVHHHSGFLLILVTPALANAGVIDSILEDPVTTVFIAVIVGAALLLHKKFDRFSAAHGGEILTTIGILGCFLGIALALSNFDTHDVSKSVPKLLEGVKTAFWVSVSGVIGALSIKLRDRLVGVSQAHTDDSPKEANLADVLNALNSIRKGLVGDAETSLVSQIKLMRQEQNDNATALNESLNTFAEKVSKLGSEQLIEALRSVIKDFNEKLTEQFGENFKQLNAAVEKLVIWQQQYKEELDKLQTVQTQTAHDLRASADSLHEVAQQANAYTETAKTLQQLLDSFHKQYDSLVNTQQNLVAVLNDMKSVEPAFSKKFTDLTEAFTTGVYSMTSQIQALVKEFGTSLTQHTQSTTELITRVVPDIQKKVNEQLQSSSESLNANFHSLNANLERELDKSLRTLAQQLASLSEKFVSDYTPLTERLRKIVEISKGI